MTATLAVAMLVGALGYVAGSYLRQFALWLADRRLESIGRRYARHTPEPPRVLPRPSIFDQDARR